MRARKNKEIDVALSNVLSGQFMVSLGLPSSILKIAFHVNCGQHQKELFLTYSSSRSIELSLRY
jgi:hypothetical protein